MVHIFTVVTGILSSALYFAEASSPPAAVIHCINTKAAECIKRHSDYSCLCGHRDTILQCLATKSPYGSYLEARDYFLGICLERIPHLVDDPDFNFELRKRKVKSPTTTHQKSETSFTFEISQTKDLVPTDNPNAGEDNEEKQEEDSIHIPDDGENEQEENIDHSPEKKKENNNKGPIENDQDTEDDRNCIDRDCNCRCYCSCDYEFENDEDENEDEDEDHGSYENDQEYGIDDNDENLNFEDDFEDKNDDEKFCNNPFDCQENSSDAENSYKFKDSIGDGEENDNLKELPNYNDNDNHEDGKEEERDFEDGNEEQDRETNEDKDENENWDDWDSLEEDDESEFCYCYCDCEKYIEKKVPLTLFSLSNKKDLSSERKLYSTTSKNAEVEKEINHPLKDKDQNRNPEIAFLTEENIDDNIVEIKNAVDFQFATPEIVFPELLKREFSVEAAAKKRQSNKKFVDEYNHRIRFGSSFFKTEKLPKSVANPDKN